MLLSHGPVGFGGRDFLGAHRLRVTFDFGRACVSIEQPSGETKGGSPARGRETG